MGVLANFGLPLGTIASNVEAFVDVFVTLYGIVLLAYLLMSWVRLPYSMTLDRIQRVAKIAHGNLVIPRSALAEAVRATTGFCGITGTVSLDATGYRTNAPTACP